MSFLKSLFSRPFAAMTSPPPIGSSLTNPPATTEKAIFAAGCFWGVEHIFRANFSLLDARVGYIGGDMTHPSYRAVCSGTTGHAEAVMLLYDPKQIRYRQLVEFFFRMHDPTTENRQGADVGSQYRSAIFTVDSEQEDVANTVLNAVDKHWYKERLATKVVPAGQWWDAETYHQLYLEKNPSGYQCAAHYVRKFPPLNTEEEEKL
ncbi:putative peptide methionine sulfoxide reductase [Tricharina praecox]|uniref:putative peptide methionine sulfoxide reductase n=1 Tax=Tricharina praecox TaxID=43433 RepID=UPI00221EC0B5|nr:putative peptide methionine sulfoxide reductase [Tricharina praecox]KAI5844856.1 putative peptide methionine sulfoxide reductase [Tricharina praecox]